MDVSVSLRRVENLLRDMLNDVLGRSIGPDWAKHSGVSDARLKKWIDRQAEEQKSKGKSDPRLIYYSDFYDIRTIVKKRWQDGLSEIFVEQREIDVLLGILEELRNPEAHRREFLAYEQSLAAGISGRIRTKIVQYYSRMQTSESYYPRFEFAQDSLGNSYSIGNGKYVKTGAKLRPGDEIHFKLVASDPLGEDIEYFMYPNCLSFVSSARTGSIQWQPHGDFSFEVTKEHVAKSFMFIAAVRSSREFHAESMLMLGGIDDRLDFNYEVLPPR